MLFGSRFHVIIEVFDLLVESNDSGLVLLSIESPRLAVVFGHQVLVVVQVESGGRVLAPQSLVLSAVCGRIGTRAGARLAVSRVWTWSGRTVAFVGLLQTYVFGQSFGVRVGLMPDLLPEGERRSLMLVLEPTNVRVHHLHHKCGSASSARIQDS